MVKKIISVATAFLMLCCMIPFGAFADDVLDVCPKCGERTYETWKDFSTEVPDLGFPVAGKYRHCASCGYTYYDWNCLGFTGYKDFDNGGEGFFLDYIKNWCSKTLGKNASAQIIDASNGGANIPAAGGRNPKGYGDEGKANVTSSGVQILWVEPFGIGNYEGSNFSSSAPKYLVAANNGSGSGPEFLFTGPVSAVYYFTAPVSGLYYIGSAGSPYDFGSFYYFDYGKWNRYDFIFNYSSPYAKSIKLKEGQSVYFFCDNHYCSSFSKSFKFNLNNAPIFVEPLGDSSITTTNNITINNNTWNGNIYTDNSTNLTYIFPQYTTINEKNETVTNISNTPIIYNSETKQYYTYDQTTKNYYYITYNAPSPSPTPAPTEKPGGSISTPETGKPGGDTGDTTGILAVLVEIRDNMIQGFLDIKAAFVAGFAELSANFTLAIENLNMNIHNIFNKKFPDQSTPETAQPTPTPSPEPTETPSPTDPPSPTPSPSPAPTGKPDGGGDTNNFWNIFIGGGSDDGTDGDHKGIFWALISLILALIAFFTNLFAGVAYLFPFLPEGVVMTINTCLFVVFLFVIIKFIMRSK